MLKRNPSIVFVDNDTDYVSNYHNDFLASSFDSAVFNTAEEALNYIYSVPVDIVVTEYKLPRMSGLDLIDIIKSDHRSSHILSVILSSDNSYSSSMNASNMGADHFLIKDDNISPEKLLSLIR